MVREISWALLGSLKFPTAVTVGFQSLGLKVVRRFLPSPKAATEPQRKLGTLEPVGLQSWVNVSRGALLRVVDEDFVGGFRGSLLQHLLPVCKAALYKLQLCSVRWSKVLAKHAYTGAIAERVP